MTSTTERVVRVDASDPRSARWAVWTVFVVHGMGTSLWVAHIPTVKGHIGLSDPALGTILFGMSCGAAAGMQLFSWITRRFSAQVTARTLAVLAPVALVLPALAWNAATLAGALVLLGAMNGLLNVAMNLQAIEVQKRLGRPIIGSCHALWSCAAIAGTLVASLTLHAGWSPVRTLSTGAVVLAASALVAGRGLVDSSAPRRTDRSGRGRTPRRVWLLGALALGTLLCEGAVGDWAGVHLHGTLHASLAVAALGYGAFSVASAMGRLAVDRLVTLVPAWRLLRCGGLLAAAGVLVVVTTSHPVVAVLGWGVTGLGLSCAVPLLYTAAGDAADDRCPRTLAVARVSTMGYLGLLVGPALIGTVARWIDLSTALLPLAAIAVLIGLFGAPLVRRDRDGAPRR